MSNHQIMTYHITQNQLKSPKINVMWVTWSQVLLFPGSLPDPFAYIFVSIAHLNVNCICILIDVYVSTFNTLLCVVLQE
jgi:hypothetical protein